MKLTLFLIVPSSPLFFRMLLRGIVDGPGAPLEYSFGFGEFILVGGNYSLKLCKNSVHPLLNVRAFQKHGANAN